MPVYHELMGRLWRVAAVCAAALTVFVARAQLIEFESGGLKYQALTKEGLTIMVAPLPSHVRSVYRLQVAIQNGGKSPFTIVPKILSTVLNPVVEVSA